MATETDAGAAGSGHRQPHERERRGVSLRAAPGDGQVAALLRNVAAGGVVRSSLFKGSLVVENPPHTMEEYFSTVCRTLFQEIERFEYSMHEDATASPTGLILVFRRK